MSEKITALTHAELVKKGSTWLFKRYPIVVTEIAVQNKSGCIWLHEKAGLGIVAHESFHATCEILRRSGVKLNSHTEETYAYYLQFLINQILKKLYGWK